MIFENEMAIVSPFLIHPVNIWVFFSRGRIERYNGQSHHVGAEPDKNKVQGRQHPSFREAIIHQIHKGDLTKKYLEWHWRGSHPAIKGSETGVPKNLIEIPARSINSSQMLQYVFEFLI